MNDNLFNSEKANLESKKGPSSCSICGIMNKSIYYHYNSESCSGCKTFFRRSIVLSKVYACKWGNNCEITKNSKCRACRFYKCLRMGMNPTTIQFPEGINKDVIDCAVKMREHQIVMCGIESVNSEEERKCPCDYRKEDVDYHKDKLSDILSSQLFLEYKFNQLRGKDSIDTSSYHYDVEKIFSRPSSLLKYSFNDNIKEKSCYKNNQQKCYMIIDMILIIDYGKTFDFWNYIPLIDQINLVKIVEAPLLIVINAFYSNSLKQKHVIYPDGSKPTLMHDEPIQLETDVYVTSIKSLARLNLSNEEYCLLKAIIFCTATSTNISAKSLAYLAATKTLYSKILMDYLEISLGSAKGAMRYADIILAIDLIFYYGEKKRQLYLMKTIIFMKHNHGYPKSPIMELILS